MTLDSVMLDLETMGTGPQGAVIQIGAAAFDYKTGQTEPHKDFLCDVDLTSSLMLGGYTDASTVAWWRERGGFPKTGPARDLRSALVLLARWFGGYPDAKEVWANGIDFDLAIMEGNYRRSGMPCPWAYNAGRDARTIFKIAARERGWVKPDLPLLHEARDDCRKQIQQLQSALAALRVSP